ncbi:MAG: hypothetical protein J3K34DRAFT_157295 [Monoraphidium minutum]|nr:MAG: hypothetical protein J3K34DRAFT_157295 [Monoraphidium minutum]
MATATKQSAEAVQQAVEERPSSSGRGAGGLVLHAPPNAPAADAGTHLQYLIHHTTPCLLRPLCFFVSWQGVLTLVYKGYAAPLVQLKSDLTEFYSALPPEMPGSLWPKTSLAALRDGARLTPEQLAALIAICWPSWWTASPRWCTSAAAWSARSASTSSRCAARPRAPAAGAWPAAAPTAAAAASAAATAAGRAAAAAAAAAGASLSTLRSRLRRSARASMAWCTRRTTPAIGLRPAGTATGRATTAATRSAPR